MRIDAADPALFSTLAEVLDRGGVVVMPCDTIYGLVGCAPQTEQRLRALKGRQSSPKSFLRLVPSLRWLGRFTDLKLPSGLRPFWPGALTVIFPARAPLAQDGVALRLPDDRLLRRLMLRLQRPLYSTSVNRSGQAPLWQVESICREFEAEVDLVVAAGDRPGRSPSTILDITGHPYRVLRQGEVHIPEQLLR